MKNFLLLAFLFLSTFNSYPESAINFELKDGSKVTIPFEGDISIIPINKDFISIVSDNSENIIDLNDLKSFCYTDIAGVDEIEINPSSWKIYSINGILIKHGEGILDTRDLEKGEIYIVKRSGLTYKYIAK